MIVRYRGYIVPNDDLAHAGKWAIKFPDFPTLNIMADSEALDPHPLSTITERCVKIVLDHLFSRLDRGQEPPQPQPPINRRPFIDVEVDLTLIRKPN